jgi:acyl-CoA reductase-like NAD-dependent aldehyde dehydrogenase
LECLCYLTDISRGGNDPCIVLPDANIAKVAPQVALGAFFNSGQVCIDSKRIYIHESIYQPFLEALIGVVKSLKVGGPNEEGVMLGPIQNEMQYEKVKTFFADSKSKGYKFALGDDTVAPSSGFFIPPTIIDNPPDDAMIVTEEPFGPIIPCQSYSDIDEVIKRANNSKAGLGATVFGTDITKAQAVADRIEAGSVWINSYPQASPQAQFGGVKESGIGTEYGTQGILAYANIKATHTYKN